MPKSPRTYHVPLYFRKGPDGQYRITLAPGVQWAITSDERAQRFEDARVTAFCQRYEQSGGNPQRVRDALEGLLRVTLSRPLPTRKALAPRVRIASEALEGLLALPGNLPGHKARKVFERAVVLLRGFDDVAQTAYLDQFMWKVPTLFAIETPLGGADCSTSLISSYPVPDRPPCSPPLPPLGSPVRGRIKSGSPDGVIIGVLAEECRRRFEAPWWPDILAVCQAMAPETFYDTCTEKRLQKQVQRVRKDWIEQLRAAVFSF